MNSKAYIHYEYASVSMEVYALKRVRLLLPLLLIAVLLFSACSADTIQIEFVANKDIKKIFDQAHTVNYILDDIRKVDFYQEMTVDDTYTQKVEKDTKIGTPVTRYYKDEDLIFSKYTLDGAELFDYHTVSTHSNDLVITYQDTGEERTGVTVSCTDDKGSYSVIFDQGLNKKSPYGADLFTVWIEPKADNATFKSEVYYTVEYKDGVTTCTLSSAKYYDKDGAFKRYSHKTDKNGVTEESNEPLYTKTETDEVLIGDSVDLVRHIQRLDGVTACEISMGDHVFSYAEKEDSTAWYIDSKIRFLFNDKKKAAAFSARYGGNSVKKIKSEKAQYAVSFDSCNLRITSDCTFPNEQNLGEFAAMDWEKKPYITITFDADANITSFALD